MLLVFGGICKMYREDLLNKNLKLEYLLLKILYLSAGKMKKSDVCKKLKISMPTLVKVIGELRLQLADEMKKGKLSFLVDRYALELQLHDSVSIDEITDILLKNSDKYKIFKYLFEHKTYDINSLANKLKVSTGTLSRSIVECNDLLDDYELKIKNKKMLGSITQYVYFYFNFFKMTSITVNSILISDIVSELSKKLVLSIVQQKHLTIWLFVTMQKVNNKISIKHLNSREKKSIHQYQHTSLFKCVQRIYCSKKYIYTQDEVNIISYLVCVFLMTVGGLSYERVQLELYSRKNPAFEITEKIMAALVSVFTFDTYVKSINTKSNIFSLICQIYYLQGVNYSIDKVTLDYYYNLFDNSFRRRFILDVIENIIIPTNLFSYKNIKYLKKRLIFLIYMLSPKKEYQVKIAVVSMGSNLLADSTMCLLKNELKRKQDVFILPYKKQEKFDLLISNVCLTELKHNYDYFYQVTTIGVDLDIRKIYSIIDKISLSKYRSFVMEMETSDEI